jgi:predicted kinase
MHVVLLCGPPCSGKTTLAHHLTEHGDTVLDFDAIARDLGSPEQWIHPEPWRTQAEQALQASVSRALADPAPSTAWVLRTAPRPAQRARLAQQWQATVYLLDPGEAECRRRAVEDQRPSGTRRSIGEWYHRYSPWSGDRDPSGLDARWVNGGPGRGYLAVDLSDL